MTTYMYIATAAWLFLVLGYVKRKNRFYHVLLMLLGLSTDICMVLYLQITRGALQKAVELSLTPLQQSHVVTSTVALVLYVPVIFLGFRLLTGNFSSGLKRMHVRLAVTALVFRSIGFVLMFSMWKD